MSGKIKYVMTGTDEEVQLGDVIETTLEKEFEDGRKLVRNQEFTLTEEAIPLALKLGIIEEVEHTLDFAEDEEDEGCPYSEIVEDLVQNVDALAKDLTDLELKVHSLEKAFKKFNAKKIKSKWVNV